MPHVTSYSNRNLVKFEVFWRKGRLSWLIPSYRNHTGIAHENRADDEQLYYEDSGEM